MLVYWGGGGGVEVSGRGGEGIIVCVSRMYVLDVNPRMQ